MSRSDSTIAAMLPGVAANRKSRDHHARVAGSAAAEGAKASSPTGPPQPERICDSHFLYCAAVSAQV